MCKLEDTSRDDHVVYAEAEVHSQGAFDPQLAAWSHPHNHGRELFRTRPAHEVTVRLENLEMFERMGVSLPT